MPSVDDLATAHRVFEEKESRDLFYRVATELVDLAIKRKTSISLAEALAVLLKTWNANFYRFHRVAFDEAHFADIERLLVTHHDDIVRLRTRSIQDVSQGDEGSLLAIFSDFETVLGPVGAAKALHLLAPNFFPLWDRKIAEGYRLPLRNTGTNAGRYWQFVKITQRQSLNLAGAQVGALILLKALDEYNYCRITKGWL